MNEHTEIGDTRSFGFNLCSNAKNWGNGSERRRYHLIVEHLCRKHGCGCAAWRSPCQPLRPWLERRHCCHLEDHDSAFLLFTPYIPKLFQYTTTVNSECKIKISLSRFLHTRNDWSLCTYELGLQNWIYATTIEHCTTTTTTTTTPQQTSARTHSTIYLTSTIQNPDLNRNNKFIEKQKANEDN